jgi:hypothetical protein
MALIENENREVKVKLCEAVHALENMKTTETSQVVEVVQEQKTDSTQSADFESKFNQAVAENQHLHQQLLKLTRNMSDKENANTAMEVEQDDLSDQNCNSRSEAAQQQLSEELIRVRSELKELGDHKQREVEEMTKKFESNEQQFNEKLHELTFKIQSRLEIKL